MDFSSSEGMATAAVRRRRRRRREQTKREAQSERLLQGVD